jgi:hypothetical protein
MESEDLKEVATLASAKEKSQPKPAHLNRLFGPSLLLWETHTEGGLEAVKRLIEESRSGIPKFKTQDLLSWETIRALAKVKIPSETAKYLMDEGEREYKMISQFPNAAVAVLARTGDKKAVESSISREEFGHIPGLKEASFNRALLNALLAEALGGEEIAIADFLTSDRDCGPITGAAMKESLEVGNAESVKFALTRGWNIHTPVQNVCEFPLIHAAAHGQKEIVEILIQAGADLALAGPEAARAAAKGKHREVALLLLDAINRIPRKPVEDGGRQIKNRFESSLELHVRIILGDLPEVKELLKHTKVAFVDAKEAVSQENETLMEEVIEAVRKQGAQAQASSWTGFWVKTLLALTIEENRTKALTCILENLVIIDEAKGQGLVDACSKKNIDAAKVLLDHGADPNWSEPTKPERPLAKAIDSGSTEILRLLIEQGAVPEREEILGGYNCFILSKCEGEWKKNVEILVKYAKSSTLKSVVQSSLSDKVSFLPKTIQQELGNRMMVDLKSKNTGTKLGVETPLEI